MRGLTLTAAKLVEPALVESYAALSSEPKAPRCNRPQTREGDASGSYTTVLCCAMQVRSTLPIGLPYQSREKISISGKPDLKLPASEDRKAGRGQQRTIPPPAR